MITPVRYNPSFEVLEEEEAKTEQGFIDTLLGISTTTYADDFNISTDADIFF